MQGDPVRHLETQRRRKDGALVEVSLSTAVFHDSTGHVQGSIGIFTDITERKSAERLWQRLTPRRREILRLIAESKTTKDIADRLGVSPKTVEFHRIRLMNQLEIHDVPGLVRFALLMGLVR